MPAAVVQRSVQPSSFGVSLPKYRSEEVPHRHAERLRQTLDVVDRHISVQALNMSYESAVKPTFERKRLL